MILGILVFFFLPNYPEQCGWLTKEEKAIQERRLGELASRFVPYFQLLGQGINFKQQAEDHLGGRKIHVDRGQTLRSLCHLYWCWVFDCLSIPIFSYYCSGIGIHWLEGTALHSPALCGCLCNHSWSVLFI